MSRKLPIAVLISGGGSTLENLIHHIQASKLDAEIRLVISSRREVRGVEIAQQAGIPVEIIRRREAESDLAYRDQVFDRIRQSQVELVVMGGFLQHLLIPQDFLYRVINIHPSLIPAFSGTGFYGLRVHQAAIEKGVKFTGCTVHFVDDQYDHGPIIAQNVCEVLPSDTPEVLQKRVFELECQLLPLVIQAIADGAVRIEQNGRAAICRGTSSIPTVEIHPE